MVSLARMPKAVAGVMEDNEEDDSLLPRAEGPVRTLFERFTASLTSRVCFSNTTEMFSVYVVDLLNPGGVDKFVVNPQLVTLEFCLGIHVHVQLVAELLFGDV